MSRYIVLRHLPQEGDMAEEAALVTAEDAASAAESGGELLMAEYPIEGEDHRWEAVAVVQLGSADPPEWFRFGLRAERCELQCCGGNGNGGHSGLCSLNEASAA